MDTEKDNTKNTEKTETGENSQAVDVTEGARDESERAPGEKTAVSFSANGGTRSVGVEFREELFSHDSAQYDHELARFCAEFAMLGYGLMRGGEDVPGETYQPENALDICGFEDVVSVRDTAVDEENYFIARRKISAEEGEYTLVFAGYIGSYVGQWYTNFDSGRGLMHLGFADAADFAYTGLRRYLEKLNADRRRVKLLLIGHSRGGAVASLVAARLIRDEIFALPENIFAYTFASPNPTRHADRSDPKYSRIFNIINKEDFVTKCMPREWGYGCYGVTLAFPEKDRSSRYNTLLSKVRGHFDAFYGAKYMPFRYGPKTVDKLFETITGTLKSVDDFYDVGLRSQGEKLSMQTYFTRTLCGLVGEPAGSKVPDAARNYMLGTFINRYASCAELKAVASFFVLYEGIGSATTGKISDTYFSYAHLAHTYCAYMLALDGDSLVRVDPPEAAGTPAEE